MSLNTPSKTFQAVAGMCLLVLGVYAGVRFLSQSSYTRQIATDIAGIACAASAVVACMMAALRLPVHTGLRRMWWLIGSAYGTWMLGTIVWTVYEVLEIPPFPSPADAFYICCLPLFFLGLLSSPKSKEGRGENLRMALDTGSAMVAGVLVFSSFIVAPLVTKGQSGLLAAVLTTIYPAQGLALLWALAAMLIQRNPLKDAAASLFLTASVLFIIVAGWRFSYQQLTGTYTGAGITDLMFIAVMLLGGLAGARMSDVAHLIALRPHSSLLKVETSSLAEERALFWRRYLTNIVTVLILLALAWSPLWQRSSLLGFLLLGSLLFVALILTRQMLTLRENQALNHSLRQTSKGLEQRTAELEKANLSLEIQISERQRVEAGQKALEVQMQQMQKLESLGVLAGGIAHDFNNLLTIIVANSAMAADFIDPAHEAQPFLADLEKACARATGLTHQMLAYSGRGAFALAQVDLNALTAEMAALLKASISKKVRIRLDFCEPLPPIEGDPSQLTQVVMNLVTNAAEAIEPGSGTITVRTGLRQVDQAFLSGAALPSPVPPGQYVFLEVADDGAGMSPETLARIFEPFFTTKFTGRGLGLSATLGIIRGHKGSIQVRSEPGAGTRITVVFPPCPMETPAPAPVAPAATAAGAPRDSPTILIVDDEELLRKVTLRALQLRGFQTLEARDGCEALEVLGGCAQKIGAIVLDLMMPVMGGEEAFYEIRRLHPAMPIVLASGYAQNAFTTRIEHEAATAFLRKPFTIAELADCLKAVMEPCHAHHLA